MDTKKALELRAERKKHKPHFVRQNAGKKIEVGTKYRKPRGYQSKMRRRKAGYLPMPSQGYRAPKVVRGTDAHGRVQKVVHTLADVAAITASESAIIGSTVGAKKRIALLEAIQQKKVATAHDVAKELDILKSVFQKRAEDKKKAEEKKEAEKKQTESKQDEKKQTDKKQPEKKLADAKPTGTQKKQADKKSSENVEEDKEETAEDKKRKEQEKILTDKKTAM